MPLRTWDGTWNTARTLRVWNGSSWVNAKSAKVWNGSSWVNFLSSVNITDQTLLVSAAGFDSASADAKYSLLSDGTARTLEISDFLFNDVAIPDEWFVGGAISDFSVRATATVFNLGQNGFFQGTLNTWESLTTTREWQLSISVFGQGQDDTARVDLTIDIAYTADLSKIIDSANIVLIVSARTA
jgi:hypothetical protein